MAANTIPVVQVSILALIIFSTFFFVNFQVLLPSTLHDHPLVQRKLVSKRLLHKLGIDLSKRARILVEDGAPGTGGADRISPGGPDPQHNRRKSPLSN
ncbi:hypothetical protein HN51_011331 [Arachis hypogaea]